MRWRLDAVSKLRVWSFVGHWFLILGILGCAHRAPKPEAIPFIPPDPWVSAINQIGFSAFQAECVSKELHNCALAPFELVQFLIQRESGDNPDRTKTLKKIQGGIFTAREHGINLKTKTEDAYRTFEFKGEWAEKLHLKKRKRIIFQTPQGSKRVPTLQGAVYEAYLNDENFQALRLRYGDGKIALYLFLPHEEIALKPFLSDINESKLQQWFPEFLERAGEVRVPHFNLNRESDLSRAAETLGLEQEPYQGTLQTIFGIGDKQSDLEKFSRPDVSEILGPEQFQMTLDRPFFFLVRDNETGLLLLLGTVTDPSKQ